MIRLLIGRTDGGLWCAGVVLGNVLARHFGFAPIIGFIVFGGGCWLLANLANATMFAEKACEPVGIRK